MNIRKSLGQNMRCKPGMRDDVKDLGKIRDFLHICIYFMTSSDTNYLQNKIKLFPENELLEMNANFFHFGYTEVTV